MLLRQLARNTVLLLVIGAAATGSAAEPGLQRSRLTPVAASEAGRRDVAVMGHVRSPGIYAFVGPAPTLEGAIQRAGGLEPAASGQIRIVRTGRAAQSTFLGPDLELTVDSGDILVAERIDVLTSTAPESMPAMDRLSGDAPQATSAQQGRVLIGVVNLFDWPVVLELARPQATLPQLFSIMGQKIETVSHVRLLPTGTERELSAAADISRSPLNSGTVLVLDPSLVDRRAIPMLPDGVTAALVEGFRPIEGLSDSASSVGDEIESDSGDPAPAASAGMPVLVVSPTDTRNESAAGSGQTMNTDRRSDAERRASAAPVATAAAGRAAKSALALTVDRRAARKTPDIKRPAAKPRLPQAGQVAARSRTARPNRPERASFDWTWWGTSVLWALGLAACLFAVGLLVSLAHRVVTESQSTQIENRRCEIPLESLIRNRLPLVEEPVLLQTGQQFYGAPREVQRIRVDAAHQPSGPRIAREPFSHPGTSHTTGVAAAIGRKGGIPKDVPAAHFPSVNTAATYATARKAAQRDNSAQVSPAVVGEQPPSGGVRQSSTVRGETGLVDRALDLLEGTSQR